MVLAEQLSLCYEHVLGRPYVVSMAKLSLCCEYVLGWVNLYQKFEIEKYSIQVVVNLFYQKKWKGIF